MQIIEQHLDVVETVKDDTYTVRCRELLIPAKLADTVKGNRKAGRDVQFARSHKGLSTITKVFRNLLKI